MKEIILTSGFPRAGSTLIQNLLAQNPEFHPSATSGLLDVLANTRLYWDTLIEHKTMPESDQVKKQVFSGIVEGYYSHINRPVVFDKSRGWLQYLELASNFTTPKVLVPVRDIRGVLSSLEKVWRNSSVTNLIGQEQSHPLKFQTIEGRCDMWIQGDQLVGMAFNRVRDAIHRGWRDNLHFVEYEKLTLNPRETMIGIYNFLQKPYFNHNFNSVEQYTHEDDTLHRMDLHTIRPQVKPQIADWNSYLGDVSEKYKGLTAELIK